MHVWIQCQSPTYCFPLSAAALRKDIYLMLFCCSIFLPAYHLHCYLLNLDTYLVTCQAILCSALIQLSSLLLVITDVIHFVHAVVAGALQEQEKAVIVISHKF